MEPLDGLELPASERTLGTAGLVVSVAGAAVGTVWLVAYDGGLASFVLVALNALLGWVSFMFRWPYEQPAPPPE